MSPRERNALLVLLVLGVGGHLVRQVRPGEGTPGPSAFDSMPSRDVDGFRERVLAGTRPLEVGETVDVDRADVLELTRVPGIGPTLAARIVADRSEHGAFGSLAALDRVAGIGPSILARAGAMLRFSGVPAEATVSDSRGTVSLNRAYAGELMKLPGIGPARARLIVAFRDSVGSFRDLTELARVPGLPGAVVERLIPLLRLD